MNDILHEIIAHKREEVARHKAEITYSDLEKQLAECRLPIYSMADALRNSPSGIIAEFKRRSPSKGWINREADAATVTCAYEAAGAAALSVLTDEKYFGGTQSDLRAVTRQVSIPAMRKEFIIDEYQIMEARLAGACSILLIAAALTKEESRRFTRFSQELGMDVILELHDESEVEYVAPENNIVGINNRNLGTFITDIQKSYQMIDLLPRDAVLVSESGISNPQTVCELRQAGYRGFLIGENFMKTENPGESLNKFIAILNSK